MKIQDEIYDLIVDPNATEFNSIPGENLSKIKKLIGGNSFENTITSHGNSFLLELLPRGQRAYAREVGKKINNITIFEAAGLGDEQRTSKLLKEDERLVNLKSSLCGMSPLHLASGFSGSPRIVEILLKYGADFDQYSQPGLIDGLTPLIAAALGGNYEILKMLLNAGADPNSQEINSKTTALHIVTAHQQVEHTKLLLEFGADLSLKTTDGRSSADNIEKSQNSAMLKFLS